MLISQFNLFLKEAGKLPLSFWSYKYYLAQKSFQLQLENIAKNIQKETKSTQDLQSFINILKKEEANSVNLRSSCWYFGIWLCSGWRNPRSANKGI